MTVDAVGPVLLVGVGDLGARIGRELLHTGRRVIGLRRSANMVPSPFEALAGDITDPLSLADAAEYCGGGDLTVVFTVTASERSEEAYNATYVQGMRNVVEALRPSRLVAVSSTAVYDVHDGSWVDETTPVAPSAFSGRAMREMEQVAEASGASACSIRLAGVYGPGRTRFVDQVRVGKATYGSLPTYTNRIHVEDAARLVVVVTETPDPPPIVVGVDDDPASRQVVIDWLADRLGVDAPDAVADFVANTNKRCRNNLARSLGFTPMYPTFREGYAAIIEGAEGS